MELGFDTIGNATLICHDGSKPILTTDPWITPNAYFGSWTLYYNIPDDKIKSIQDSKYIWFSHGHPDHFNPDSIPLLKGKTILLSDHVGARLKTSLIEKGFEVRVLEDYKWHTLSDNIKVFTISDYNQDSIILVDVDGTLLVNLNDAWDQGWGKRVRKIAKQYDKSFLLALIAYADTDMHNWYDEDGNFLPMQDFDPNYPLGRDAALRTESFNCKYLIPFSFFHRYQREDSRWADQYAVRLEAYYRGFESKQCEILPPFLSYDCKTHQYHEINPPLNEYEFKKPEEFGDNWSDQADDSDIRKIEKYLKSFEHVCKHLDFIRFKIGGKEHTIELQKRNFVRGITFETPLGSLMTSVEYEIFDDLMIANFTKATLHGKWSASKLYPDFTPYIAKYGDNGYAKTEAELKKYFKEYVKRNPADLTFRMIEKFFEDTFRSAFHETSPIYKAIKPLYWKLKGI